jgi:hypothetical protein
VTDPAIVEARRGLWRHLPVAGLTRGRCGAGADLGAFAALFRGGPQFWQARRDFEGLTRRICHKRTLAFRGRASLAPRVMPANAGIQIQPLRLKPRGGGFWIPAFARVTNGRRGGGAVIRGRLQFWQACHDFKGLTRRICHKRTLAFRGRGRASLAPRVMPANAGIQIQPLRLKPHGGGFWTPACARVTRGRR